MTQHTDEETAFNYQIELSRLPTHVIKETEFGPIRFVGQSGFDTDAAKTFLRDDQRRGELLKYIGPMRASTPGFYTFLNEERASCELQNAETIQIEYRIYPDRGGQQALMDGIMSVATSMRYV